VAEPVDIPPSICQHDSVHIEAQKQITPFRASYWCPPGRKSVPKIMHRCHLKRTPKPGPGLSGLVLTLATLALAGCGTTYPYKQADKTGESITTLRTDVAKIKTAVDGSIKALDALEASANTNPRKPYDAFAKSVDQVDSAAQTVRKHTEAMRQSGQAYFQMWEQQLSAVQSQDIRQMAMDRKAKVQQAFDNIKNGAQDAKTSFPPFLDNLKDLKRVLGSDLTLDGFMAAKDIFKKTRDSGVQVQKDLDALITEFDTMFATFTANRVPDK
jgi:hypothetical protein